MSTFTTAVCLRVGAAAVAAEQDRQTRLPKAKAPDAPARKYGMGV